MIETIRSSFLEYHQDLGFSTPDPFPLVIDDPSVLFTNATITPFKSMFAGEVDFANFAFAQKCLRLGGTGGNINTPRDNTNYTSLFEMLGSGLFEVDHSEALAYFVDMLDALGLDRNNMLYSSIGSQALTESLLTSGLDSSQIRIFDDPNVMQHDWSFGEGDLHGVGVIAWYASEGHMKNPALADCVQIGRIVHIDGITEDDSVNPFHYNAFDVGLGMSRVELALTGESGESLKPWRIISDHFRELFDEITEGDSHYFANLYRVVDELTAEGLMPGSKKHAYVLRKIVRTLIEDIWLKSDELVDVASTLHFASDDATSNPIMGAAISEEEKALRKILSKVDATKTKHPEMSPEELHATYGIKPSLLRLI